MENLYEFLSAVASHWFLLSMAALSLLVGRFGSFDPDKKIFPILVLAAIVFIVWALYLAVTEPLSAINAPR